MAARFVRVERRQRAAESGRMPSTSIVLPVVLVLLESAMATEQLVQLGPWENSSVGDEPPDH